MNPIPSRRFRGRRALITASLVLVAGLSLVTLAPGTRQGIRAVEAEARRSGQLEHKIIRVSTADSREAIIHCWEPKSSNAVEVTFEQQGNRVLVRAKPRDPSAR